MTADIPEDLRARAVEAAAEALVGYYDLLRGHRGQPDECDYGQAREMIDAVLPLVAGHYEARWAGERTELLRIAQAQRRNDEDDAAILRDAQIRLDEQTKMTAEAEAQLRDTRAELEQWRSGRRRRSWPVIDAVPDGLTYAAKLVRAQGTDGGDEHDELLRSAAIRLLNLHDTAGPLLADRDRLSAELAEARTTIARTLAEHGHADTCGSTLSPDAGYPCSCWRAALRGDRTEPTCKLCGATGEGCHKVVCPTMAQPPRCAYPPDDDPGGFR